MFVTQALRMAADLSFYYSVAGLLTLAKGGTAAAPFWNLFLLCVFFALSCLLSLKTKAWRDGSTGLRILHGVLRYLPAALGTAAVLALSPTLPDRIAGGIAAGYVFVLLVRKREYPDRDRVLGNLIAQCIVFLFALLIAASEGEVSFLGIVCIPMVLVMFFSSVLLLRILRLPDEAAGEGGFAGTNAVLLGIPVLSALVLALPAVQSAVLTALSFLWNRVVVPVLILLLWGLFWICYGVVWLVSRLFPDSGGITIPEQVLEEQLSSYGAQEAVQQVQQQVSPFLLFLRQILPFAAIAVAAILVYRFLASGRGTGWEGLTPDPVSEEKLSQPGGGRRRGSRERAGTQRDADRVRAEYRRYLKYCRQSGIEFDASNTSEEILAREEAQDGESGDARALRDLYLRARYDGTADRGDVRRAQEFVRRIQGKER